MIKLLRLVYKYQGHSMLIVLFNISMVYTFDEITDLSDKTQNSSYLTRKMFPRATMQHYLAIIVTVLPTSLEYFNQFLLQSVSFLKEK